MKTVAEVIRYFEHLYMSSAVYVFGMNGEIITPESVDKAYKAYGSNTYNKAYYDDKLIEGQGRIGADCSGAMYPMSGGDNTAQGYYNACNDKGVIAKIDKNKPCLVFKGTASNKITHIGFYCGNGYVIEMKSSKENCVKAPLDGNGWKFYGVPRWIDYSVEKSNEVLGVDLSSNQGDIDFNKLQQSGIKFAILRSILKSGSPDKMFKTYLANVDKIGIIPSVYIYSYDTTDLEAITSAQRVINLLNGRKMTIFLDMEDKTTLNKIGKERVNSVAKTFIQTCKQNGYRCFIYCNLDWYKNVIDPSLKPYALWIARYGKNDGHIDQVYKPNLDEKIWQYTSKGTIQGINGYVDMDVCYDMSIFDSIKNENPKPSYIIDTIDKMGKITANSLHIRKEPSASSQSLGYYHKDEIVPLIGYVPDNGWYKTDKGFISGKYVKLITS